MCQTRHRIYSRVALLCSLTGVTLLVVFCVPSNVFATSSQFALYEGDFFGTEGEDYTIDATIEDGGSYAVEFNKEFGAIVGHDGSFFEYEGYVYFIPDSGNGDRELAGHIGGFDGAETFSFEQAGEYELDIYSVPPPVVTAIPWWKQLVLNYLTIPTVHAQSPEHFIETIHFTITEAGAKQECCSSVVFLPGIKGSILKKKELVGSDTLWPPTIWSNDVSELALTSGGESVNDVFVDGIIETFKGVSVYDGFTSYMDRLVSDGTIAAWEPLPYDWRLSFEKVLTDGVELKDDTMDLVAEIERVAQDSDTGQVTIVAHSMGGLLGKALIKKLDERGEADLIDSFVMVGSPQLGTPKAIASLLHGDGEGIPNYDSGIQSVLNNSYAEPSVARDIAHNMSSSYALLPSPEYFLDVFDPVVNFDPETSKTDTWRDIWGDHISDYIALVSFLTGGGDSRDAPSSDDLKTPAVLDTGIITDVAAYHTEFDSYELPSNIRVVQVAGWGLPTVKGIEYTEEHGTLDYKPVFTQEGDQTVLYPSAVLDEYTESYFLNLALLNKNSAEDFSHYDLLSALPVQEMITKIVEEQSVSDVEFLSEGKPNISEVNDQLLVSAHSPVILGVYDAHGNFTGIDNNTEKIVEGISGSSFQIFGQSQYIFVPKNGRYTFEYKGTGSGSTTIKVESFFNDIATSEVRFSDIPTTDETSASFSVDAADLINTEIDVDLDGDGFIDRTVLSDGHVDPPEPPKPPKSVQKGPTLYKLLKNLSVQVGRLHPSRPVGVDVRKEIGVLKRQAVTNKVQARKTLAKIEGQIKKAQRLKIIPTKNANSILKILREIKNLL